MQMRCIFRSVLLVLVLSSVCVKPSMRGRSSRREQMKTVFVYLLVEDDYYRHAKCPVEHGLFKKHSIGEFLEKCIEKRLKEFTNLPSVYSRDWAFCSLDINGILLRDYAADHDAEHVVYHNTDKNFQIWQKKRLNMIVMLEDLAKPGESKSVLIVDIYEKPYASPEKIASDAGLKTDELTRARISKSVSYAEKGSFDFRELQLRSTYFFNYFVLHFYSESLVLHLQKKASVPKPAVSTESRTVRRRNSSVKPLIDLSTPSKQSQQPQQTRQQTQRQNRRSNTGNRRRNTTAGNRRAQRADDKIHLLVRLQNTQNDEIKETSYQLVVEPQDEKSPLDLWTRKLGFISTRKIEAFVFATPESGHNADEIPENSQRLDVDHKYYYATLPYTKRMTVLIRRKEIGEIFGVPYKDPFKENESHLLSAAKETPSQTEAEKPTNPFLDGEKVDGASAGQGRRRRSETPENPFATRQNTFNSEFGDDTGIGAPSREGNDSEDERWMRELSSRIGRRERF